MIETRRFHIFSTHSAVGQSPLGKTRAKRYSNRRGGVLQLPVEDTSNKTEESGWDTATKADANASSVSRVAGMVLWWSSRIFYSS